MADNFGVATLFTIPPPETVSVGETYHIEGEAKFMGQLGAPPWVYLRVQKKEWNLYKPL